ncbi:hypothetical protein [Paenibacillus piscarius]|uniref:hypothetical protein n=1 Tax=Paenibacillus piscarius TaxID=1089681 RepID=UPI001EE79072|nr:hypothetical protein [Paenibacillus piscarius]
MLGSFAPPPDTRLDILNDVFARIGIDFYKEITGEYWGFIYEKVIWRGIYSDEEGKPFILTISGNTLENWDFLMEAGWFLDPVSTLPKDDLSDSCFIGMLADTGRYFIYHPESLWKSFYEANGTKLHMSSYACSEIERLIQTHHSSLMMYVLRFEAGQTHRRKTELFKAWLQGMQPGTVTRKPEVIRGEGIAGMKFMLEDLQLFAQHGHEEWMNAWGRWISSRLYILSQQRQGNRRYLEEWMSQACNWTIQDEINHCVDVWCMDYEMMYTGNLLHKLGAWVAEIIKAEERLFHAFATL